MEKIFIIFIFFLILLLIKILSEYLINNKRRRLNNALNANYFIQTINKLIDENKYNLLEERIRLRNIDAYGNEDLKKWIGNPPLDEYSIDEDLRNGSKNFKFA